MLYLSATQIEFHSFNYKNISNNSYMVQMILDIMEYKRLICLILVNVDIPDIHPIRVIEQGNYHVIVVTEYSGVQHPMISMVFIP